MPQLTFLGAARTVTGSKYLVEIGTTRVLVDCGLFQGQYELRRRNWDELPVRADSIDAVVLTHAHLDHVGYLPRLAAQGFRGRVFCTPGTQDLAQLVLVDAAHLQEEDAQTGEPGPVLEARSRDAALHGHRCMARAVAAAAGRVRSSDARRSRYRGHVRADGTPARLGGRRHALRRRGAHDRLRRRSRTLRPARAPGSAADRRRGRAAVRVDLRRPAARAGRRGSAAGDDRHRDACARRQARDSGVRDWTGRGSPLLAQAARRREEDSGAAGLRG